MQQTTSDSTIDESIAVRKHFNMRANEYSQLFEIGNKTGSAFIFRKRRDIVVSITNVFSKSLLDCASGTGEITDCVIKSGSFERIHINDFSSEMLERAIRLIGNHEAMTSSCTDIFKIQEYVREQSFDTILCLGLIAHTGRMDELFEVLAQVLSDNGVIILQSSLLDHIGTRLVRFASNARHERMFGYRQTFFTLQQIRAAAGAAGLVVNSVERFGCGIPFGDRLFPRLNHWLEQCFQGISRHYGAEAVITLSHAKGISSD